MFGFLFDKIKSLTPHSAHDGVHKKSMVIKTQAGDLTLTPATVNHLRGIAHYWPMELISTKETPGRYGLVFQHGEEEVHGIKMQTADGPKADAIKFHYLCRIIIAAALPHYLEKQHRGVLVPCAYFKEKGPDLAEAGIAFFVGPDPASKSTSEELKNFEFDERFGAGATAMVLDMMRAIGKALEEFKQPPLTIIGLDIRPRLAIGSIVIHFVIQGSEVIVAKDCKVEEDPIWEYVVRAGFSSLPYAPMTPTGFLAKLPSDTEQV